jgi:hypothetical protein
MPQRGQFATWTLPKHEIEEMMVSADATGVVISKSG